MSLRKLRPVLAIVAAFSLISCSSFVNKTKDRERAKVYLQRAIDQFNERQYNPSIESAQESLKFDPEMAAAYNHLALVYMETKRYQKSEEAFKKALTLQVQYPEVFNNLGVLLNRQDRYTDAIPWFEKALADDTYSTPENPYTNMGYSYFRLGSVSRAKAYHQKALDVSPQFCLASKNMGDVYAKEKNFAKASEYYERALTNCALYQEAQYKLGLVMMKLGKRSVARTQLEKLVERHKNGPYVERSNEVLKYLR